MNFEQFLQQKNIIPKTIARHQREVEKYKFWLQEIDPINTTKKQVLDYLKYLKESRKLQNATQNQLLQILKNYYSYLSIEYGINNPTNFIKIRGIKKKQLRPLFNKEELEQLCDVYYYYIQEYKPTAKEKRFYPDQNRLLLGRYIALTLCCYQGLKPKEILVLTKDSFDFRKAKIIIQEHQKGKGRILSLEASQIGVLMQFYALENTQLIPNLNHLEKLNITLKTLSKKHEDLRQIRSSKIVLWIKQYGLRKAQVLAGHRTINSTEKYLSNNFESLQNDFLNFHPLR